MQFLDVADMERMDAELKRAVLTSFTPEERLEGLSPENRLEGLSPEERLEGLSPEERQRLKRLLENRDENPTGEK